MNEQNYIPNSLPHTPASRTRYVLPIILCVLVLLGIGIFAYITTFSKPTPIPVVAPPSTEGTSIFSTETKTAISKIQKEIVTGAITPEEGLRRIETILNATTTTSR